MHNLNDFLSLYGRSDLDRICQIKSPINECVFIDRLHEEIGLIIRTLEEGRKERSSDGEDRLSMEIVACLRTAGYLAEKDPTHGGHVDVLVRPERKKDMKWYGEAKIWKGPEHLSDGINQLITRYASGRERNLGFFVYFKCDSLVNKMTDWKNFISSRPDFYVNDFREIDDYSFTSCHAHTSGAKIFVRHFAVNIFWAPDKTASANII